jgi:peptide/nickel transport system substrate-binding protein
MQLKRILLLITIFALPLLLDSCKKSPPQTHKYYGDTLIIGGFQKPTIINPILTSGSGSASLIDILFDGLIRIDENGEIKPNLAESWKISENGLEWIFYLRKEVKFHDEVKLTAEDVKFTFDKFRKYKERNVYSRIFKLIDRVEIIGQYAIKIYLLKSSLSFLSGLNVGIIPKHLLEKENLETSKFNYNPIGTGPFKLKSLSEKEIILDANKEYFRGRPYLDGIIVKIYENQKIAWAKLISGELDLIFLFTPGKFDITNKVSSIKFYTHLHRYYHFIGFNHENELFKDKRVRQALNYAVNKEEIINKVLKGRGRICSGTVYPLSWAYNPKIKPYPYDPEKAINLLKEAGWEDTDSDYILDKRGKKFKFSLYLNEGDDMLMQCALLLQQFLLDIGVKMAVEVIPVFDFIANLNNKNFKSGLIYMVSTYDPDNNYIFWHSSQIQEGKNVFSYKNQKVDRLLEEGRITLNQEKRKEIYYQLQKEMFEDPPGIFLFWREALTGINGRFRGIKIDPGGLLRNVHEWWVPKEEQKY